MALSVEKIAQVTHAANTAYQTVVPNPTVSVSPPWDLLKGHERESIVAGVVGILEGKTPEESHQAWVDYKTAQGWRWGTVKDVNRLTHPNLVPYDSLPESEKVKDHLFSAIITALGDVDRHCPNCEC